MDIINSLLRQIDFKVSLMASVFLHGGLLALALLTLSAKPQLSPLPLGVELAYVDSASATSGNSEVKVSRQLVAAQVQPFESVVKPEASEPQAKDNEPLAVQHQLETLREGQGFQAGQATGQEGVSNGSEVSIETRYVYEIRKLLERKKIYPSMAKSMGQEGTVYVKFTLDRQGRVIDLVFEKQSHKILNDATAKLIKSIEGLKPFPPEIAKSTWTLSVPVEYSLR